MKTVVGAAEPDGPDPARGFVANLSATYPAPYLYEVRDDTVPLTRVTTPTASGSNLPLIYRIDFPGGQTK